MPALLDDDTKAALEREQAARAEVFPFVGALPAMPAVSSELIYRQALIRLGVNISDLPLDNLDATTAFRDRFRRRVGIDNQALDDIDRATLKSMQELEKALDDWEQAFGEPYPVEEDGGATLNASQVYKAALIRLGVDVPDDVQPSAYAAMFRAARNSADRTGAGSVATQAIDSARLDAFHRRFPTIPPRRWA
jgi:hypothetical protein